MTLPLRYLLTAAGAFLLAALSIPLLADELAGFYHRPALAALTHTVTLGWITLTIMGASFQLVPIALERKIWSERPFLPGPFFATIHAHFHLAFLGWVSAMILGVAARVLPMFLPGGEPKGWAACFPRPPWPSPLPAAHTCFRRSGWYGDAGGLNWTGGSGSSSPAPRSPSSPGRPLKGRATGSSSSEWPRSRSPWRPRRRRESRGLGSGLSN